MFFLQSKKVGYCSSRAGEGEGDKQGLILPSAVHPVLLLRGAETLAGSLIWGFGEETACAIAFPAFR